MSEPPEDIGSSLRHGEESRPPPPPTFENLVAGGLFAASALLAGPATVALAVRESEWPVAIAFGPALVAYHALQTFAVWRIRPSERHGGYLVAFVPILVQGAIFGTFWFKAGAVGFGLAPWSFAPGPPLAALAAIAFVLAPLCAIGLQVCAVHGRMLFVVGGAAPVAMIPLGAAWLFLELIRV